MAGTGIRLGQLVSSKAGRDHGDFYLIVGKAEDRFLLLADGRMRTIQRPKKKNIRHLIFHQKVAFDLEGKLASGENVTDDNIRQALAELVEEK